MLKKSFLILTSAFLLLTSTPVFAATRDIICNQIGQSSSGSLNCDPGESQVLINSAVDRIVNLLIFALGAASVVVIIVAGLMYVLSGGNPQNTARAKDAIIYAVVGLVIAIMARLIINFVLSRV